MKTIHKLLSLLLFFISTLAHSQNEITIQAVVTPPYQLRLEEYTNNPENIILNVTNNTSQEFEIKFLATLVGNNGISISTVGQPPVPYVLAANSTQTLTGMDIENMYLEFDESDVNISGASPEARSQIINNRILPEGSYKLCIQALHYTTAKRLSNDKIGCADFDIIHPERPIIITPYAEEELMPSTPSLVRFSWTRPINASAELLSRLSYSLRVVDLSQYQELNISPQEALLNPNSDFIVHEQNIKASMFNAFDDNFIANHKYAVMVIAKDEASEIPIAYNGQSEIVEFFYGKVEKTLNNISLASVYPINGDILPFRKLPCIIEVEPETPVSDRENYTKMTLHEMSIDEEERRIYTRNANDVNNWGRRGLVAYMRDQLGEPLSPRYYQFWINKAEDFQEHNRGKKHSWTAEMSFNDETEVRHTTGGYFTSGMTAPIPELPENGAIVAPGEIAFKFATGTAPNQLLPYYDIYRLNTRLVPSGANSTLSDAEEGSSKEDKEPIKVGKSKPRNKIKDQSIQSSSEAPSASSYTSVTDIGTAFYEVNERYVFQVSKDENFRSVIYTLSEPIIVDADEMPTDFKNNTQRQEYAEKIYKDDHAITSITEEGTYYWRIVYLSDPTELTEEQYRTITPKQYYQTSEVFSFTIGEEKSNAVVITSPNNGSSLSSNPKPRFVWKLPRINGKDSTNLTGRLAVIDITYLTEDDDVNRESFRENNSAVQYLNFTGNTTSWTYDDTTKNQNITYPTETNRQIFLEPDHQYAAMIDVRYPDGTTGDIHNDGYSNIVKFRYLNATPETTDCRADIMFAVSSETATDLGAITEFTAGYFLVKNLRNVTNNSGVYSGEGVIQIPTLGNIPIAVEFSNIRLNAAKELISGEVTGKRNTAYAGVLPTVGTENSMQELTSNGTLNAWLESLGNQDINNPTSISLPLKFEPEIGGKKAMFGITGLKLQKNIAHISMGHEIQIGSFAGADDQWFGTAFTIALTPNGFGFEDVEIGPNRDLQIGVGSGADWAFVLKSQRNEGGRTRGTHMKLTCGGIERFEIDAEVHFPTKILVKNMANGSQGADNDPVKGKFNFAYVRGASTPNPDRVSSTDIMVAFTMDEFQVKGVEGWGFRLDEGYIDLSALENPEGMVFPDNYQHFATSIPDGANAEQRSSIANSWKGFFLKEMAIQAPKDFYKAAGDRQFVTGIRNLIIDGTGFSANFISENIIDINKGQVEKFAFSLDQVEIRILQNAFLSGSLNGKFAIPISKNTERGRVDYEAILAYTLPQINGEATSTQREWGFFMNVQTRNDMVVPIPALMAEATLAENSYVRVRLGEGTIPEDQTNVDVSTVAENSLSLYLNGNMNISSNNTESGDSNTLDNLATAINFRGMDFELKYNSATGIDNAHSRIAFASPQKTMGEGTGATTEGNGAGGFDVSITDVTFENGSPVFDEILQKNFCLDISASMDLSVSLMASSGGGFEASTRLTFNARFFDDTEETAFNRVFKLTSVDIDCISIGINGSEQSGVTFDGTICFFKDHSIYGNGVGGKLRVGLPIVEVEMASIFGSKRKADGSNFKYWFVDGKAIFEEGGITMGSIQLLGLGGGIYWNMELQNAGTDASKSDPNGNSGAYNQQLVNNAASMQEETPASNPEVPTSIDEGFSSLSGFNPTPKDGSKLFKLMIPIASAGDKSIFNMDVSVTVGVTTGMGLTQFSIVGNGYVMAEPTREDRRKAPVNLDVIIDFQKNEEYKLFDATIGVYANIGNDDLYIRGITPMKSYDGVDRFSFVHAQFHVQSFNDRSRKNDNVVYFKLGSPNRPGGLEANVADLVQVEIRNYLQIGNHLDDDEFMPLPSLITEVFNRTNVGRGGGLSGGNVTGIDRGFPKSHNEGFIMGLQAQTSVDIRAFILRVYLQVAFGFDLHMTNYGEDAICYGKNGTVYDPFGSNGWYAKGQLYAGIKGKLSLYIDLFFTEMELDLFELGAAFLIQGGFPNPVWAEGKAGIYYSILGGRIDGSANFNFSVGDKCVPPRTDPFGFPIIEAIDPEDREKGVSSFANVAASFSIPMDRDFEVPVELGEDGQEYIDVEIYRPYIDKFTLTSNKNGAIRTKDIDYRAGNNVAVRTPERLLNDEKVNVNLLVKAWKKVGDNYIQAVVPEGNNAGKEWKEEKQISFTVGEAPERIPESIVKQTYPVKNQRYFLKDEIKKGDISFYRDVKSVYFSQPKAPNNIREVDGKTYQVNNEYLARFYSLDGSQVIDKPLTIRRNHVAFDIPEELQNEHIYNLHIIRKENLVGNNISSINLANINTNITSTNVLTEAQQHVRTIMEVSKKELYMNAVIKRNAHLLIPGRQERKGEITLLSIPFRTSKYNTVLEKVESCTDVTYNNSRDLYYSSGMDLPDEYLSKAIDITCGEPFDEVDLYGTKTTDGEVVEQDQNTSNSNWQRPMFAFSPEVNGTRFWNRKARSMYNNIKYMSKLNRYEATKSNISSTITQNNNSESTIAMRTTSKWVSEPNLGTVKVKDIKTNIILLNLAYENYIFEIPRLKRLNEYELMPQIEENEAISLMRFTRFKRGVKPLLTEGEVINQASNYIRARYAETRTTNTRTSRILSTGAINSLGDVSNSLLNTRVNRSVLTALNSNTLTLMYDLHQAVTLDNNYLNYVFKNYNETMYEVIKNIANTDGTILTFSGGYFTREQLKRQLGSRYYSVKRTTQSLMRYDATSNPGQYKLRIGRYIYGNKNIGELFLPGVVKTFDL